MANSKTKIDIIKNFLKIIIKTKQKNVQKLLKIYFVIAKTNKRK